MLLRPLEYTGGVVAKIVIAAEQNLKLRRGAASLSAIKDPARRLSKAQTSQRECARPRDEITGRHCRANRFREIDAGLLEHTTFNGMLARE